MTNFVLTFCLLRFHISVQQMAAYSRQALLLVPIMTAGWLGLSAI